VLILTGYIEGDESSAQTRDNGRVQTFVPGKEKEVRGVDLWTTSPPDADKPRRAAAIGVARDDWPQWRAR
jgi:hypothetical protein